MMAFEVRHGFEQIKALQVQSMDDHLRNLLWNLHDELFNEICPPRCYESDKQSLNSLLEHYWKYFFKQSIHRFEFALYSHQRINQIREEYYKLPWYKVYSFLEFNAKFLEDYMHGRYQSYTQNCNSILEKENSAWRFIGNTIAPIISTIEIEEIENALVMQDAASRHIESATILLANKEHDQSYESIAQSISAVEAVAKKIGGNLDATLSSLCSHSKILPKHSQFRQALLNLYTYTSSKEGQRHGRVDDMQPVNKELARFMLVICSAFVNLIRSESDITFQKEPEGAS